MSILNALKKKKPNVTPQAAEGVVTEVGKKAQASISRDKFSSGTVKSFLRQAWPSEKAHALKEEDQYVFLVERAANKKAIRDEVRRRFGVAVHSVNTINVRGKVKRLGNRLGQRSSFKKAIVTLKKGEKLEII